MTDETAGAQFAEHVRREFIAYVKEQPPEFVQNAREILASPVGHDLDVVEMARRVVDVVEGTLPLVCCGCSCHTCVKGHNTGAPHTEECQVRFWRRQDRRQKSGGS